MAPLPRFSTAGRVRSTRCSCLIAGLSPVQTLLKRIPERRDAVLHGFRRHRIQQQVFPAMIPGSNTDKVHGQVTPKPPVPFGAFCLTQCRTSHTGSSP